ncbi:hypothetical protein [Actinokineospora sp. UTMC 2448]|uniref:hypothetical protein n=1 Tax=Actinokineospora sp. UTMC 2448 TaxID=2268449 RepID=UPI0021647786|nr:hypothetical protein [Actinokineospora sp. UTMC 2448]UVS80607.1 hypothetical protein Actkin_04358 [Actinokineospora sp. UTMC 2448]
MPPRGSAAFGAFVAELRATGWIPLPIGPPFALFVAVRFGVDGSQDSFIVYDLDHVVSQRQYADGSSGWSVVGDLPTVVARLIGDQ